MSINQTGEQHIRGEVSIGRAVREVRGGDNGIEDGGDLAGGARDNEGGRGQTAADDGSRRGEDGNGRDLGIHCEGLEGGSKGECQLKRDKLRGRSKERSKERAREKRAKIAITRDKPSKESGRRR